MTMQCPGWMTHAPERCTALNPPPNRILYQIKYISFGVTRAVKLRCNLYSSWVSDTDVLMATSLHNPLTSQLKLTERNQRTKLEKTTKLVYLIVSHPRRSSLQHHQISRRGQTPCAPHHVSRKMTERAHREVRQPPGLRQMGSERSLCGHGDAAVRPGSPPLTERKRNLGCLSGWLVPPRRAASSLGGK